MRDRLRGCGFSCFRRDMAWTSTIRSRKAREPCSPRGRPSHLNSDTVAAEAVASTHEPRHGPQRSSTAGQRVLATKQWRTPRCDHPVETRALARVSHVHFTIARRCVSLFHFVCVMIFFFRGDEEWLWSREEGQRRASQHFTRRVTDSQRSRQ